jgi:fatty-acyl-CoA synthase
MTSSPEMTLASWLRERTQLTPNRRALTFEGTTWSYATFLDRVEKAASVLRDGGVRHGDRVAFLGLNHPAYFETLFGAARLGAIFVPLNFRLTGPELTYVINDSGAHTIVADGLHRAVIDSIRPEIPCRRFLTYENDSEIEGWESLGALVAGAPALEGWEPHDPNEVAVIMYTSGTTGSPKGAMLTHGNLFWTDIAGLLLADTLENDVSLVCAPLFHIGGLNVTTLATWLKGGEVVLHRNFDPGKWLADVAEHGVTTTFAVPAMLLFVSMHPEFDSADLTTLRTIACGGAPVPEGLIKLYNGRGIRINQGYGLTETSPAGTFLTSEWALEKIGSAGRPPMFVEAKLVDSEKNPVTAPHVRGEMCIRGPNVMKGYWNRPQATAEAIDPDGWFHTGDVAYRDEDGFYYIADRIKDMVITGGENVYPAEVEGVLFEHPSVADVAVIGLPDERWGEIVVAIAVAKPGEDLSLESLRDFAGEKLAKYKMPRRLELVDVLPRNPAGKILKFELRNQFSVHDG